MEIKTAKEILLELQDNRHDYQTIEEDSKKKWVNYDKLIEAIKEKAHFTAKTEDEFQKGFETFAILLLKDLKHKVHVPVIR